MGAFGVVDLGDCLLDREHHLRQLAGDEVVLVLAGDGDDDVRRFRPGRPERLGGGAVAADDRDLQPLEHFGAGPPVGLDDNDVVFLFL